jgi:hypothetical protein
VSWVSESWANVVALDSQPVLRNLLITQGYHELSDGFARMLGPENVTWFTFASWSSKVVGQFIQNQELPGLVRTWIEGAEGDRMQRLNTQLRSLHTEPGDTQHVALDTAVRCAVNDMRMYLATGNTQVFAELAPVFSRFLDEFGSDRARDDAKLQRFVDTLKPGAIEPDKVVIDPKTRELTMISRPCQTLLAEAVRHYYTAKFELDAKRRAELILLANATIGLHEQTRLQTYIAGSLNAPIADALVNAEHDALAERIGTQVLGARGFALVDRLLAPLTDHVERVFQRFATELMMTLKLPGETLHLGCDLPAPPGQPLYPKALQTLADAELGMMFAQYNALAERSEEHDAMRAIEEAAEVLMGRLGFGESFALGSGADDWVQLSQRMRYILDLFRSRQQDQRLLQPTFTAAQVSVMKSGKLPDGPLT